MGRTLIVTNDFPPRQGGIEVFVHAMATRMPASDVVVHTSSEPGAAAYDATLPFPVIREPTRTLLPTRHATSRVLATAREHGCDRAWFGAAAPLAAMAPALRDGGIRRMVATTHGHEVWWARVPGARRCMRRIGDGVDVVTYLGEYTRTRIAPALGPHAHLSRLAPGVDTEEFRPDPPTGPARTLRERYGLRGKKVILSVSRLVARKGQDALVRALPLIQRAVPDAALLIVGDGPQRARLHRLARACPAGSVAFAGGIGHADMPPFYAAADVFALPCRTRKLGLEAEGLGIVFLEAAAAGLPVVAGDSGGAPDAVLDGETGTLVDGASVGAVARSVTELLRCPERARQRGEAGRRWVEKEWTWDAAAAELRGLLDA